MDKQQMIVLRVPQPKPPRIDNLSVGAVVNIEVKCGALSTGHYIERAVFLGIDGVGDEREAMFVSLTGDRESTYRWSAYRMGGRWVMGSSADRISLLDASLDHFHQSAEERVGW